MAFTATFIRQQPVWKTGLAQKRSPLIPKLGQSQAILLVVTSYHLCPLRAVPFLSTSSPYISLLLHSPPPSCHEAYKHISI